MSTSPSARPHSSTTWRFFPTIPIILASFISGLACYGQSDETRITSEERLKKTVQYLSSDKLNGRGIGTEGLDLAADHIANEFETLGLDTNLFDDTPFQKFNLLAKSKLGSPEQNRLVFHRTSTESGTLPSKIELTLNEDFRPLSVGGTNTARAPLVFVGYGISAKNPPYDDFANIDVAGKILIIVRKEPEQGDPKSKFNGTDPSRHAFFTNKISHAAEHGAAAVILVNDHFGLGVSSSVNQRELVETVDELLAKTQGKISPDSPGLFDEVIVSLLNKLSALREKERVGFDQLLGFADAGSGGKHRKLPVFFCHRDPIDRILQSAAQVSLAELEEKIDDNLTPQSFEIPGWLAECESQVIHQEAEVRNVAGVLEATGISPAETIVIAAHYDHLGMGGAGSLAPWTYEIHNGADDNASGTAVLLELAKTFSERKSRQHRLLFIAFAGEERGLLGSGFYVKNPLFPLEKTIAMINLDMVGRLQENKLIVHGTGTAVEFNQFVDSANKIHQFDLQKKPSGYGPSDHNSFYTQNIPVLHFFTGTHSDYHRPSDDYELINFPGMNRITDFVTQIIESIDQAAPTFQAAE